CQILNQTIVIAQEPLRVNRLRRVQLQGLRVLILWRCLPNSGALQAWRWLRIPMAKPKGLVFEVDHLEPNGMTEADLAKIRALYNIPESVKMQIPGPLESLSNPDGEVCFFTNVFKHGLWLPLRHSVQKILAAIGYAPRQFNPNFLEYTPWDDHGVRHSQ
ncbi:unnamed protein product, partial [Prunus brigantina]